MTVDNYMTRNPITVGPEATAEEIARLMVQHRIGCLPVVDREGALLGLITERELFLQERRVPFSTVIAHSLMGAWVDTDQLEECYEKLRDIRAEELMARNVATIAPSTPTGEAARLMVKMERNHLPVIENGKLVGILARHDLLRALLRRCEPAPQGPASPPAGG
jgi:CBS domain-containing protein